MKFPLIPDHHCSSLLFLKNLAVAGVEPQTQIQSPNSSFILGLLCGLGKSLPLSVFHGMDLGGFQGYFWL
jgi:hypothetical protein